MLLWVIYLRLTPFPILGLHYQSLLTESICLPIKHYFEFGMTKGYHVAIGNVSGLVGTVEGRASSFGIREAQNQFSDDPYILAEYRKYHSIKKKPVAAPIEPVTAPTLKNKGKRR